MESLPVAPRVVRCEVEVGLRLQMVQEGAPVSPVRSVLTRHVGHRCVLRKQFAVRGAEGAEPVDAIYRTRLALNLISILFLPRKRDRSRPSCRRAPPCRVRRQVLRALRVIITAEPAVVRREPRGVLAAQRV